MEKRTLITISLLAAVAAGAGAFGCSATEEEEAGGTNDQVVAGSAGAVLKSTLFLESGCTAVKVGPKHILVAARCVQGNAAIAPGKILGFSSAAAGMNTIAAPTATTAADGGASDAGRADSGREAGAPADAGRVDSGDATDSNASARGAKIAEVIVHPSFAAKCKDDTCGFNKLDASDAPDIAVITLEEELTSVPTVPVDLDAVGQSDPVLVVNSGCADLSAKITTAAVASKTIAVPARAANHEGSPYKASPQLSTRLASSYVVTPGAGWKAGEPRLCKSDIGAPLFRANAHAVAGITSNFTTYTTSGKIQPVTMHHTRVDTASRFKIGSWLSDMGVETVHSCSETAGGCVKRNYDGGVPGETTTGTTEPGDGGTVIDPDGGDTDSGATAPAEEEPTGPRNEQLPEEEPEYASEEEADFGDAAVTKKKKKAAEGGCSAAPGQPAPTGGIAIGMMLALGAIVARRRK